jgi:hypothetical protein
MVRFGTVRRVAVMAAVVATTLGGALLTAAPAQADDATTVSCDDGSSGGTGGYTSTSDCATQIATYEAYGCTVTHSDVPSGQEDTLTVDCSAGNPGNEYDTAGAAKVQHTVKRGTGDKENTYPVKQVKATLTCGGFSSGLGDALYHIQQAQADCRAKLTTEVNEWADRIFNIVVVGERYGNLRSSTRCDKATFTNHVRDFNPLFIVTTTGTVLCTTIVYGSPIGG